jgi:N-formylmaleamate deformylase
MPICRRSSRRAAIAGAVFAAILPGLLESQTLNAAAAEAKPAARSFAVTRSGSGRPLIFIPGLASSPDVWKETVAHLRKHHDCHVLELAGFAGRKAVPAPSFLTAVRDDLIRYVREEKLERPVVVGHSLGGVIALWAAATAPDAFGGVVSVDGVPFLSALRDSTMTPEAVKPQAEAMRRMYASLKGDDLEAAARMSVSAMVRSSWDVDRIARWMRVSDSATVGQALYEAMTTDLRETVSAIEVPTLVVAAAEPAADDAGRAAVTAAYEDQFRRIPDHRVVLAPKARHFVMLDDPGFLRTTIEEFLAGQASRQAAGSGR